MCVCVCVCVLVAQLCLTLCAPMNYSLPGSSLSMEFPRQKYWNGLPFPSPGDLPDPGIEPGSPALQANFLLSEPPEKPYFFSGHFFIDRYLLSAQIQRIDF